MGEGGFSQKSRGLNRLGPERRIFQAYPGTCFLPLYTWEIAVILLILLSGSRPRSDIWEM